MNRTLTVLIGFVLSTAMFACAAESATDESAASDALESVPHVGTYGATINPNDNEGSDRVKSTDDTLFDQIKVSVQGSDLTNVHAFRGDNTDIKSEDVDVRLKPTLPTVARNPQVNWH